MKDDRNICRVCGYDFGYPIRDEDDFGSFEICPCCFCEFGYDDFHSGSIALEEISEEFKNDSDPDVQGVKEYRKRWLNRELRWQKEHPEQPWAFPLVPTPPNWNLEEQMNNIPAKWR